MSQEIGTKLNQSEKKKLMAVGTKPNISDLNAEHNSTFEEENIEADQNLPGLKEEDTSYAVPKLLFELEAEIFVRVSSFQYWKLNFLNKEFSRLLQSCEIFKMRRERGLMKPHVFVFSSGDTRWKLFDKDFKNFRKLPRVPSDCCFIYGEKEIVTAGTHLIVTGKDVKGFVVWRYELQMNKWTKDSGMITPRVKYGSASRGTEAFFAGGIMRDKNGILEVVSVAEKYNADTRRWEMISGMHKRRKFSSGFIFLGKFFVLGGVDENDEYLTCGESYDEITDSWKLVPDMLKDVLKYMTFMSPQSLPLISVVNDNLYLLEKCSKEVRVYDIDENVWKKLGVVPVKIASGIGWGVTFNSFGDRLMVIGNSTIENSRESTLSIYTCRPSPNVKELIWEEYKHSCDGVQFGYFICNCCVMIA